MATQLAATVSLQGDSLLIGKGHTGHEVRIDYLPPLGGDDGFMPLELLLTSLAACSCHTVLFLLRKMGKTVETFEVRAVGNRREEHPTGFTAIELRYELAGAALDAASVARAIRLAEETYCPVWAMLQGSVTLSSSYRVLA
ncbi:osmotically inducible protein OsmC [Geotalea uraniireducens]|uniref:Osmotically inducible protein OsmC n=1 Tax=Geotalea uraniireducens TaxID=351604 RepID=A0ABM8EKE5_9BACT|nr:OsmC family protein [Geotalea uraniireducens]BDV42966.1 osmotically inducible protein OsmC [Geotalea uraniireducens]